MSGSESERQKDAWDKLGSLTTLFSTIVIGAAGIWATYVFNNKQLQLQSSIEHTKELVTLYDYVSSPDAGRRRFGYAMFSALGEDRLALDLMTANTDPAGQPVAENIAATESGETAQQAKSISSGLKIAGWISSINAPGATTSSSTSGNTAATGGQTNATSTGSSSSPGSGTQNMANLNQLHTWIETHPVSRGVPIARFLYSTDPQLVTARHQAIADLKIAPTP